ncbi:MAG: hypothetical protein ACTSQE_04105 [Candidatus Heimdallarchaeaceae archaeon]
MGKKNKEKKQVKDPDEEEKKWSWLGWGLLFLIVWMVALMFILEVAIHPTDSFIATIVAYILGLLGLSIFAGLTRSKWKVLVTFPLALIIVFGLGFLLHFLNAPVYNPLAPVSERVFIIVDELDAISNTTVGQNIPADLMDNLNAIKQYELLAFVVDLIIALPIFILGTLSVTWLVQIFTKKPKWWVIFPAFFALVFFMIGMVLTPTIHLLVAGVTDLGTNMSIGALYMVDGLSVLSDLQNADQDDINKAVTSLNLASDWFEKSGEDISVMLWSLGFAPYIGDVSDDLNHLFQAAFILFDGVGPFVNGTYQIFQGFDLITGALNTSEATFMAQEGNIKQTIDDDLFNLGLEYINDGLSYFANSSYVIDDAMEEIKQVNWDDIKTAIHELPIEGAENVDPALDEMQTYIGLFENATDLIDILINKPTFENGTQSDYATLIHFLKGAYNIMKAQEIIGAETNFIGTEAYFNRAGEHFNVTYNALNTPEVTALINSDTPVLNGTLAFMVDMTGLAADLSFFGGDLGPTITAMNNTISIFSNGFENITNYDEIRADLNDSIDATEELKISAYSLDNRIASVQQNASEEIYGEFSQTAYEFTSNFQQFNLTQNVENANYIANSFYYLFGAMQDLKDVRENVLAGKDAFDDSDYGVAYANFSAANTSLDSAIPQMWSASWYFNQTVGMDQLAGAKDALAVIYFGLVDIQDDIIQITNIASSGSPSNEEITEVENRVIHIIDTLNDVNTQLQGVTAQ